jgi:energy-coupling factor transporter ATP-binding protein EcfA2
MIRRACSVRAAVVLVLRMGMLMDRMLQHLLWERIDTDSRLDDEVGLLVMAAADGPDVLDEALEGRAVDRAEPAATVEQPVEPVGAYLGPVAVEGFRGVGPRASLLLRPGPGLTLVVGRNGSGKSSFAEAIEILLTGDNRRWSERSVIWREGWRNLHHPAPTEISAELAVEGTRGGATARRCWPPGTELDHSVTEIQPHGQPKTDLRSLGWEQALVAFRPFLSYNELGSMLDEGPSKLYDALSSVLGLDELVTIEKLLGDARKAREKAHKDALAALQGLLLGLEQLDDDRARRCVQALSGRRWDTDAVESVLLGTDTGTEAAGELEVLRRLCSVEGPSVEQAMEAAERLREAAAAVAAVAGTDAERARTLADILQRALDFHAGHGDGDCPVCGRRGALDPAWRASAEAQVGELHKAAETAEAAGRRRVQAVRVARELLTAPPPVLGQAQRVSVDADEALAAWQQWAQGPPGDDPDPLAEHLECRLDPLVAALEAVRAAAGAALYRKEGEWRPMARDLAAWLGPTRQAQRDLGSVPSLKAAEKWMKQTSSDLRNQRFEPVAEEAQRIWELLRQQSNVALARPELEGTGTRRRVKLDVTVDGVGGAALGVMSQGELHSLALSLFLPRAMLPESPFRFVVIDDPVQSMDPARVDGLARVLEEVGGKRQLVVFTHDDRLAEAVRRLGIDARILEVTRQPGSVVTVVEALDPVERHLGDARVIARDGELPAEVAVRLVPGFCRGAIEAACTEVVRRRRLGRGEGHAAVEQLLLGLTTSKQLMALALFDDPSRAGDVYAGLNRFGRWAGTAFRAANEGAHGEYAGDLSKLVRDARDLATRIGALP